MRTWRVVGSISLIIFAFLAGYFVAGWRASLTSSPLETAAAEAAVHDYFEAVVKDDRAKAEATLDGPALASYRQRLSNQPPLPKAELEALTVTWKAKAGTFAVAEAVATAKVFSTSGGIQDTQAARLHLTQDSGQWLIYAIEAIPLPFAGEPPAEPGAAKRLVEQFLTSVVAGKYREAAELLAGPARTNAETHLQTIEQANLQFRAEEVRYSDATDEHSGTTWITADYKGGVGAASRGIRLICEVRTFAGRPLITQVHFVVKDR